MTLRSDFKIKVRFYPKSILYIPLERTHEPLYRALASADDVPMHQFPIFSDYTRDTAVIFMCARSVMAQKTEYRVALVDLIANVAKHELPQFQLDSGVSSWLFFNGKTNIAAPHVENHSKLEDKINYYLYSMCITRNISTLRDYAFEVIHSVDRKIFVEIFRQYFFELYLSAFEDQPV